MKFIDKIFNALTSLTESSYDNTILPMVNLFDEMCESSEVTLSKLMPELFSDEIEWEFYVTKYSVYNRTVDIELLVNHEDYPKFRPKISVSLYVDVRGNCVIYFKDKCISRNIITDAYSAQETLNTLFIEKVGKCWSTKKLVGK